MLLRSKRKCIRPNDSFWKQLIGFEQQINGDGNNTVSMKKFGQNEIMKASVYEAEMTGMILIK